MDQSTARIVNHTTESEKSLERYLVKRVKELGGLCLKYTSHTQAGFPDRVCLLPYGRTAWVELKSKGCHPTKQQQRRHYEMDLIGFVVHVCDSRHSIDDMLRDMGYEI